MKPEITRKPTPRQVEALRTGAAHAQGIIDVTADKRTHEGLVGRDLADWKRPETLGHSVHGTPLCVITKAGRAYMAKLDGASEVAQPEEVAPAPVKVRRGDMVMVELRPTYATQKPGESVTSGKVSDFRLMTVRGLTRDGKIRTVSDDRWGSGDYQGYEQKFEGMLHRTGAYSLLPASMWDLGRALEIARGHVYPGSTQPRGFESMEAARVALAPARRGGESVSAPVVADERPVGVVVDGLAEDAARAVYGARFERSGRFETPGAVYASGELAESLRGLGLVREDGPRLMLSERGVAVAEELEARRAVEREARAAELRAVEERDREAGVISDEQLDMWVAGRAGKGPQNSAVALRPLDPAVRPAVMREAQAFMNVTPGWTLSGAVWEAAKNVPVGRTPGGDLADTLMAHDPTGEKAAVGAARGQGWESFVGDAVAADGDRKAVSAPVSAEERPGAPMVPAPAVEPVVAPVDTRAGVLARLDAVWSKGYVTSPCMTHEERRVAAEIVADDYTEGGARLVHGRDRAALVTEYRAKDPYDLMNAYGSVRLRTGGDVWALVARLRAGERAESLLRVVEPHVRSEAYMLVVVSARGDESPANVAAAVAVVAVVTQELRGGATVHRHASGALRVVRESGIQLMFRPMAV
ncbi:hypothetical protein ACFQ6C_25765 [Streptomyces sp. NPDC056454]|uniref:hypothetical protein n=1 Tax=Streptomyces sp. NPDC056454 TaxID=3345823 RepID=UPI0036CF1387